MLVQEGMCIVDWCRRVCVLWIGAGGYVCCGLDMGKKPHIRMCELCEAFLKITAMEMLCFCSSDRTNSAYGTRRCSLTHRGHTSLIATPLFLGDRSLPPPMSSQILRFADPSPGHRSPARHKVTNYSTGQSKANLCMRVNSS